MSILHDEFMQEIKEDQKMFAEWYNDLKETMKQERQAQKRNKKKRRRPALSNESKR